MSSSQQIIIFEGPDGCGKTNISTALSEKIRVPYFKNKDEWKFFVDNPSYFVNALTYGDPYFLSYLEQTGASVIVDRWYPSEWVYSQVLTALQIWMLWSMLIAEPQHLVQRL